MQSNVKRKIISLNVRGIREQTKRRSIFTYLKDQKADFYFLQEKYSDANDEAMFCPRGESMATRERDTFFRDRSDPEGRCHRTKEAKQKKKEKD